MNESDLGSIRAFVLFGLLFPMRSVCSVGAHYYYLMVTSSRLIIYWLYLRFLWMMSSRTSRPVMSDQNKQIVNGPELFQFNGPETCLFPSSVDRQPAQRHVRWRRHYGGPGGPIQPQRPKVWVNRMWDWTDQREPVLTHLCLSVSVLEGKKETSDSELFAERLELMLQ